MIDKALDELDLPPFVAPRTGFDLSSNLPLLKQNFREHGFKNLKMWYQTSNFPLDDYNIVKEYFKGLTPF